MAELKNDIEKYLRGELTSAERHALERKALHDPFLADALEGAASIDIDDFAADLKSLQASLQQNTRTKGKVVPLWMWAARIAAGLLILAVGTFVFFQWRNTNNETLDRQLAETRQKDVSSSDPAETAAVAHDSVVVSSDIASSENQAEEIATKPQADQGFLSMAESDREPVAPAREAETDAVVFKNRSVSPPAFTADSVVTASGSIMVQQRGIANNVNTDTIKYAYTHTDDVTVLTPQPKGLVRTQAESKRKEKAESVPAAMDQAPETSYRVRAENNTYVITGKVTDAEDGDGLPGVNVLVKGTNYGAVTDGEGNYKITVDEANPSLVFTFIGMENKEVKVEDAREVNVAMVNDMTQLSEIVVVGYGAEKMEEEIPGRIEFANPMGGRAAFKKYLEETMRYPQQALANEIEGKVTIQFTVQTSGDLSDFRVVRGIGYGCEEEVIRLLKNGPKWNPTRKSDEPVVGKIKVKVKFRLPGK
jgi:TonB family protein